MQVENLRKRIDQLDSKIVKLLNSRADISLKIGNLKKKYGRSIYSPDREAQVLRKIKSLNKGPLKDKSLEAIYREVMSFSLCQDRPLKIAYLGPDATFTHLAALKKFGTQVEYAPCANIPEVFLEVERGNADYGVVPIENSVEGAISHTLDMLVDSELKICSQMSLNVSHNLLAKCTRERIKRVYSNPSVFGQCRMWLQKNLPRVETIDVSSTTHAAQIAAKEKNSACIASLLAAKVYGLNVLAKGIEDSPYNVTRFLVIGRNSSGRTGRDKTSIMFSIKDRVGALHDMLVPFKKYGINLTKIESRPSKRKPWEYYFFVDLEGHWEDPMVRKAIKKLEGNCNFLKILGSYPIGE